MNKNKARNQTNLLKHAVLSLTLFFALITSSFSSLLQAETVTYYITDLTGSPIAAMDEAGGLKWRESYNPYGETRLNPTANKDDVGFTGHQQDDVTGLTYMQARYYDPVIGRFYGIDPVGFTGEVDTFNRYSYVANNPYKYLDPTGSSKASIKARRMRALAKAIVPKNSKIGRILQKADLVDEVFTAARTGNKSAGKAALSKLKSLTSNSKVGDFVKTPDNAKAAFIKLKGNQGFKDKKTGTLMQKSNSDHTNKAADGGEWKAGNKPGNIPTKSNKTTITSGQDGGCILKRDGC